MATLTVDTQSPIRGFVFTHVASALSGASSTATSNDDESHTDKLSSRRFFTFCVSKEHAREIAGRNIGAKLIRFIVGRHASLRLIHDKWNIARGVPPIN